MNIIDGRALAQKIRAELKEKIAVLGQKPGLGVILVGNDPASRLYVSLKEKACLEAGINFEKRLFSAETKEELILEAVEQFNQAPNINGILVQLPLPSHFDANRVISALNPKKDADGFHPHNIQLLKEGRPLIEPVLAKAVWALIEAALKERGEPDKKQALIIGKSDVFAETLEYFLRQKGLEAAHLHPEQISSSPNKCGNADIIIVALGRPNALSAADFKDGAIVIDVGINRLPDGRCVGDINWPSTQNKTGWITPVPGGVGPVTVVMLLENVFILSQKQNAA
ncbi:MAG: bifunctional 5,10-methylenetetrahydrofolate dehydrogenase/5,10-methenyltetrahydrofolate cyclohydrolase [Candidatus Magasanikbacteria bacterium]|nr:bifunctional 5,10-methylenetetrahydrofolate dehydrogenase/5,10-methenyltetrahydrofolate cyclohydrolase [Candidatus Magasanikbacteria bacterium]